MAAADDATHQAVRERAIGLLARREHAPKELAFKLTQRGYPTSLVAAVVDELEAENLLSSRRYAESVVRVRTQKGRGPVRIRDELAGQGIDAAEIEQALAVAEVDWFELAFQARRKRFGEQPPADYPDKARQMRFLQQRGFSHEHIKAAFAFEH